MVIAPYLLLREVVPHADFDTPERLAAAIKSLPLKLVAPRPLDEAISSAGGVPFEALDERLILRELPGVFCAREMVSGRYISGRYVLAYLTRGRLKDD